MHKWVNLYMESRQYKVLQAFAFLLYLRERFIYLKYYIDLGCVSKSLFIGPEWVTLALDR